MLQDEGYSVNKSRSRKSPAHWSFAAQHITTNLMDYGNAVDYLPVPEVSHSRRITRLKSRPARLGSSLEAQGNKVCFQEHWILTELTSLHL